MFVNTDDTTTKTFPIVGGGIQVTDITGFQATSLLNTPQTHIVPFSGQADYYGLDADVWYASKLNVKFVGYNSANGGAFNDVSYNIRSQNRFYRT